MHGVPDRVLLRHLLAKAGGSRREAPRRAGVGRSTMYRWFDAGLLEQPLESRRHPLDIVRRRIARGHATVMHYVLRSPTVRDRAADVVLAPHRCD